MSISTVFAGHKTGEKYPLTIKTEERLALDRETFQKSQMLNEDFQIINSVFGKSFP